MKKSKFDELKARGLNFLSRQQMRVLIGGYGDSAICSATCSGNGTVICDDECEHDDEQCKTDCQQSFDVWCDNYCYSGV